MTLSIMRDRRQERLSRGQCPDCDGDLDSDWRCDLCGRDGAVEFFGLPFVSPYLERPLRSLEQARRDIERKERIDG